MGRGQGCGHSWKDEFALAVLASNTFQFLVTDEDVQASLARIRSALIDGGQLVFSTRNPLNREWEQWNPSNAFDVTDHAGRELRMIYQVESVEGDVITFTETTANRLDEPLRVDRASLRFLDTDGVRAALDAAGFEIEAQYGDWSRTPFTPAGEDIVIVARTS